MKPLPVQVTIWENFHQTQLEWYFKNMKIFTRAGKQQCSFWGKEIGEKRCKSWNNERIVNYLWSEVM